MHHLNEKILIVFGTRPEFIKLLPLFHIIRTREVNESFITIFTGQNRELLAPLFCNFDFRPDIEIPYQDHGNSIVRSFSAITLKLQESIDQIRADMSIKYIVGQGDTTSCLAAAFVAFMNRIPFANVEAGLRTYDFFNPFPEEYNRRLITHSTSVHFAPTTSAKQNLINEGINESQIILTGNTIVDSVELFHNTPCSGKILNSIKESHQNVMITVHRRENQEGVLNKLIDAIKKIAAVNRDINFIWISHSNPIVKSQLLKSEIDTLENITVLEPLDYEEILLAYRHIQLIITDSGGIQEEASYFGVPVIVCREKTERIESIENGIAILQGSDLLDFYDKMLDLLKTQVRPLKNLYGNGNAANQILDILLNECVNECL